LKFAYPFIVNVLILALPLRGQVSATRKGLWLTLGAGYGLGRFNCDNCSGPQHQDGDVFHISGGWAVTPQLLAGVEYRFWSNGPSGASGRMNSVAIGVAIYPHRTRGMFIGASVGDGGFREGQYHASGRGYVVATGWDVRLPGPFSITPELAYAFGYLGEVRVAGRTATNGWRQSVLALSIGLTVR